eukprot:TRINITY_DN2397_c0_g1_i1.p1 TRINITY_DN2397_c0_g1~~TRINITY_DN2397_c0_g1_i1.p1  ORF type:complete len:135 (-),score=40.39 TRINITY_DN2397_c0_g1_i1:67-435(-)
MEEDAELEALRQRRLAELKAQSGGNQANFQEQHEKQRELEERRKFILEQILDSEARERLSRVSLVKPEKARQVEDMLISAAQSGRLGGKVSEEKLKSLLNEIAEKQTKTKITYTRRGLEDDD